MPGRLVDVSLNIKNEHVHDLVRQAAERTGLSQTSTRHRDRPAWQARLSRKVDDLVASLDLRVVPFDAEQAAVARQAYRDDGRGSGHPAALNVGDCFSYALASVRREPLLFVGDDFTHTDVRSVL